MSKPVHKYDQQAYKAALSEEERKARKAFYFLEKLMDSEPGLRKKMSEINAMLKKKKIGRAEADALMDEATLEAMRKKA